MSDQPIAIIGKSGQVSTQLQLAAQKRGIPIRAAGRPDIDIADTQSILSFLADAKPGLVINAAAYTAVDRAEENPEQAEKVNVTGAAVVSALCATLDVPLMHLSTDYVFNGLKNEPYVETDAMCPVNVYGASKAAGEMAVSAAVPRHVILRTAWVYGPHGENFVKTMLRVGATRDEVTVVDDQVGCPTSSADLADHILDIAPGLMQASASDKVWGTYHLTGSGPATWYEFAVEIFRLAQKEGQKVPNVLPIPSSDYPTPAKRPARSVLDTAKFQKAFGITIPRWQDSLAAAMPKIIAAL